MSTYIPHNDMIYLELYQSILLHNIINHLLHYHKVKCTTLPLIWNTFHQYGVENSGEPKNIIMKIKELETISPAI